MSKGAFIARNGALWPMDDDGREIIAALKPDKQVMVRVHAPRNIRHHRLMFAVQKKIIEAGVWTGAKDDLLDYLKIAARHVKTIIGPDGDVSYVPRSIAFESMDQAAFNRFFERVLWVICNRLLKGHNLEALRQEIIEMVDQRPEGMHGDWEPDQ